MKSIQKHPKACKAQGTWKQGMIPYRSSGSSGSSRLGWALNSMFLCYLLFVGPNFPHKPGEHSNSTPYMDRIIVHLVEGYVCFPWGFLNTLGQGGWNLPWLPSWHLYPLALRPESFFNQSSEAGTDGVRRIWEGRPPGYVTAYLL